MVSRINRNSILKDYVEFTNWKIIEHDLRGIDPPYWIMVQQKRHRAIYISTDQELTDIYNRI